LNSFNVATCNGMSNKVFTIHIPLNYIIIFPHFGILPLKALLFTNQAKREEYTARSIKLWMWNWAESKKNRKWRKDFYYLNFRIPFHKFYHLIFCLTGSLPGFSFPILGQTGSIIPW
jgi:hypothetical protein